MDTRPDFEPRQWAAAGLISCLVMSGGLGLLIDSGPVMGAVTTPERMESVDSSYGPVRTHTVHVVTEDATITPGQAYVKISSRADYRATTTNTSTRITYTVQPGDSLWRIADKYDTDPSTLFSLNSDLQSTVIRPGEELVVLPGFRGLSHTVSRGETLSEIASVYGLSIEQIMAFNNLESGDYLQIGQELLLPGAQPRQDRSMTASSRSASSRRSGGQALGWIWPITGGLHSSEFGEPRWGSAHTGIDIAVPAGTPAVAVAGGTVLFSGWDGGYGYSVILDHGDGLQTRYAHASKLLVSEGQSVGQGESVIHVGATGNSTGPHLHFEVLVEGTARNPRLYLP